MRMCGIATAARAAADEVAGTRARVLDTRKTAPGLRHLDKYAVACGGALNHRMGLHDAVMIKDTHLAACGGSIGAALRRALARGHPAAEVTVEVSSLEQLNEALTGRAGRVLLDNMSPEQVRRAVELAGGRVVLEVSGGLRPGGLRAMAETGVDFLSVGWLTHSAPAADVAMELELAA
jgi:nicotinate-nucleotide pyrophosphorylase (carboxylating)